MTGGENGCFALVTYLPEPISGALQEMCAALPGDVHSRPHVTVLPPRRLVRPVAELLPELAEILGGTAPFEVGFNQVCVFADTRVLYLDVDEGCQEIEYLHGVLAARQTDGCREEHAFRPHLTLAGPLPHNQLSVARREAEAAWAKIEASSRFRVEQVELLQLAPGGGKADWQQVWSQKLGVPRVCETKPV